MTAYYCRDKNLVFHDLPPYKAANVRAAGGESLKKRSDEGLA